MPKIDAHIHYPGDHPAAINLLEAFDLKLLNICYVSEPGNSWRAQAEMYRQLTADHPTRFAWCTSFDLPRFDDPDYVDRVITGLEEDFRAGAIACKIWKNVGMEVRKPSGEFLLLDDPLFEPIFDYLTWRGATLLLHMAEPLACWQPLDPIQPHYTYYRNNPQWHMYNKPEYPSHGALMDARDRVVEKHPGLRIVGAHFGSLEYDVAEMAKRFDRYPNFAVDSSARLLDMTLQDPEVVRQFFIAYQDRLLFGTDVVQSQALSAMTADERQAHLARMREVFQTDLAYYESGQEMTIRGRSVQGLGLPDPVLEKFCYENARTWYPGL